MLPMYMYTVWAKWRDCDVETGGASSYIWGLKALNSLSFSRNINTYLRLSGATEIVLPGSSIAVADVQSFFGCTFCATVFTLAWFCSVCSGVNRLIRRCTCNAGTTGMVRRNHPAVAH